MSYTWTQERMVRLLLDAALAHRVRGDRARAKELLDEALELSRSERQASWLAAVRASQGVLARMEGDLEAAGEHLREALEIRRSIADRIGQARALGDLAAVHLAGGDLQSASHFIDEAIAISSASEPGRTRAEVLEHGAQVHARLGDRARARVLLEEARRVYERLGDTMSREQIDHRLRDLSGHEIVSSGADLDGQLAQIERTRLLDALEQEAWNQSRAARRLGVTETRVRNLMRRHGLRPRNRRGRPRKSAGLDSV